MTTGMCLNPSSALISARHLPPVPAGQVQVEEDEVGHGHVGMLSLPPQEGHRLLAIPGDVQVVADLAARQPLPGQIDVPGIVFHQQDLDGSPQLYSCSHRATPTASTWLMI